MESIFSERQIACLFGNLNGLFTNFALAYFILTKLSLGAGSIVSWFEISHALGG